MNLSGMLNNFNTVLFMLINSGAGYYTPLDLFFVAVTSYTALWSVMGIVLYYVAIYLPVKVYAGVERKVAQLRAGVMVFSVFATWVVVHFMKLMISSPRPFITLKEIKILITAPDTYSFPSGHAAVSMALATAIYFYYPRLGKFLFAFAFIVGLSRIFVGVHYPGDVIVGLLLGCIIPMGIHTLFEFVKIAPDAKKG